MGSIRITTAAKVMLYDPEFKKGAGKFALESPGRNFINSVGTLAELVMAIDTYEGVEGLFFNTHGSPGKLELADGTSVPAGSLALMAIKNPKFLAKNAQVLFMGCKVGADAAGDLFMDDVAKAFLIGKGGIVGAATASTFDFDLGPIFIPDRLPLWGDLKVYRYDDAAKRVASVVK